MTCYLVSYDVTDSKNHEQDYQVLYEALENIAGHRPLKNDIWFISTDSTARDVLNHLKSLVNDKVAILVVPFSKEPARHLARKGTNDWLSKYLG